MTAAEIQSLKALFVVTASYFNHEIPDDVLVMYVEDMKDLNYMAVAAAIGNLRRDPKTTKCPLPSQIRAKLTPESNPESEATMIVGRIIEAISRVGPYEVAKAKAAIGPVGWTLVSMEGGWEHVCSVETDKLPTLKAQWRQTAKALIERGVGANDTKALPGPRDAGLTPLGEMLERITQRLPEDPK